MADTSAFVSQIVESINVIADDDRLFEATLHTDGQISINTQDAEGDATDNTYSLDEIRTIVSTLGHLVWVADNRDEDADEY